MLKVTMLSAAAALAALAPSGAVAEGPSNSAYNAGAERGKVAQRCETRRCCRWEMTSSGWVRKCTS